MTAILNTLKYIPIRQNSAEKARKIVSRQLGTLVKILSGNSKYLSNNN